MLVCQVMSKYLFICLSTLVLRKWNVFCLSQSAIHEWLEMTLSEKWKTLNWLNQSVELKNELILIFQYNSPSVYFDKSFHSQNPPTY